uniref:Uncharacterized protein n=1 Tax=Panagrolaimus sp. ES5 TaxID=591445 RepID=A0AC34GZB5_9BILA
MIYKFLKNRYVGFAVGFVGLERKTIKQDSFSSNSNFHYTNINLNQECIYNNAKIEKNVYNTLNLRSKGLTKNDILAEHDNSNDFFKPFKDYRAEKPSAFILPHLCEVICKKSDYGQHEYDTSSSTNSSTVSLHIAAYENAPDDKNFVEGETFSLTAVKKKEWKGVKQIITAAAALVNNNLIKSKFIAMF